VAQILHAPSVIMRFFANVHKRTHNRELVRACVRVCVCVRLSIIWYPKLLNGIW